MAPGKGVERLIPDVDLTRRQALQGVLGGSLALGAGKAIDNVLLGYGKIVGTNLVEQDLSKWTGERFQPHRATFGIDGYTLEFRTGGVEVFDGDDEHVASAHVDRTTPGEAADLDERLGLSGSPIEQLVRDVTSINAGEYRFEFSRTPAFLDRIAGATPRPYTVGVVRGPRFGGIEPSTIREFAGVDPADIEPLMEGLAGGFREYSGYDTPQYIAGSIEDNVLMGAVDLRRFFRSPTDFEGILSGSVSGLFCYHFTYRSIEAFHAVQPQRQSVPVVGAVVTDARHKHVYTGLASLVRDEDELVVPMTFVDYMHSTQYDDFNLRGVLGEGIEAYDRRHRTDGIYWNRYARW